MGTIITTSAKALSGQNLAAVQVLDLIVILFLISLMIVKEILNTNGEPYNICYKERKLYAERIIDIALIPFLYTFIYVLIYRIINVDSFYP